MPIGVLTWDSEEGSGFRPNGGVQVALVTYSLLRKPAMVPVDTLEIIND